MSKTYLRQELAKGEKRNLVLILNNLLHCTVIHHTRWFIQYCPRKREREGEELFQLIIIIVIIVQFVVIVSVVDQQSQTIIVFIVVERMGQACFSIETDPWMFKRFMRSDSLSRRERIIDQTKNAFGSLYFGMRTISLRIRSIHFFDVFSNSSGGKSSTQWVILFCVSNFVVPPNGVWPVTST